MKKGVRSYLSENYGADHFEALSCQTHVEDLFDRNYQHKIKNKGNYAMMRQQLLWLQRHGDPRYKYRIWGAIKKHWEETLGESAVAQSFYDNHIKKNSGWMSGTAPYGIKHNNQAKENGNNHHVKRPLNAALKNEGFKGKCPVPCDFGVAALRDHMREESKEAEKRLLAGHGFDLQKVYTAEEEHSGLAWIRHCDTIPLGNGLYGCRQKNAGENSPTTEEELKKAIDIHRRILNASEDDEVNLTWEDLKLVCTCIFTSIDCCVNCPVWVDKCGCYHTVGVRYQEGADWLNVRGQQAAVRDVIISTNNKKTR